MVFVLAGALGWLTLGITRGPDSTAAQGPFGVSFTLVSQNGQPITEKALRGRPSVVFFGYTNCPDVCPTTLFEMNDWLQKVDPDGSRLGAYFVTVDPERDTPQIMNEYVSNVSKRITGISGPPDQVLDMVKGFRVYAKKVPTDEKEPGRRLYDGPRPRSSCSTVRRFAGTIAYQEDPDIARSWRS